MPVSGVSGTAAVKRAGFALALLSLFWGYNWIAMKVSLAYASPVQSAATRFTLAAACLAPVARYMGRSLLVPRSEWRYVAIMSVLLAVNFSATLLALDLGGVGRTAVLVYTMPFWVIVIAHVWLKEKMRPLQWAAIGLAFTGLLALVDPRGWLPTLLAVLSGASWAYSVVLIKSLQGRMKTHLMSLTVWQMTLCAVCLWLFNAVVPAAPIQWAWPFLAAIAFSAILGSALSWMLFYYALARLPAGLAGLGTLATPVIGVIAAWIHFGERPSAQDAMGMLLIALGLALLALPGARKFSDP